jgi:hypothetical protein
MTIICQRCNKIKDVPDPPGYEDMDIIERFISWRGLDHAICSECIREMLAKSEEASN